MRSKLTTLELTYAELATIAKLTGNLMASAFEAGLDPGVLESLYYKTNQHLDVSEEIF